MNGKTKAVLQYELDELYLLRDRLNAQLNAARAELKAVMHGSEAIEAEANVLRGTVDQLQEELQSEREARIRHEGCEAAFRIAHETLAKVLARGGNP